MLSYLCLLGAIIFEVSGTLLLPVSEIFTKLIPTAGLTVCYLIGFFSADLCDQEHPDFNSLCHLEWAWSVFCRHIRTLCLPGTASLAGGFRLSHDHLRGHSGEYLQPSSWLKGRSLPKNPMAAHETFPEIDPLFLTLRSKRFFLR